ncbi:hypothetical protein ZWY2020_033376 [Hordeum vulgare]|nr:hypothetical protein ZWY2020_033376 [Hordeum vulgare]
MYYINTFYSCLLISLFPHRGVNCRVVKWIDQPWSIIMQRCLLKLWQIDDTKLERDFLEEEVNMLKENKKKIENVVSELVDKGLANRDDLLMIKEILEG